MSTLSIRSLASTAVAEFLFGLRAYVTAGFAGMAVGALYGFATYRAPEPAPMPPAEISTAPDIAPASVPRPDDKPLDEPKEPGAGAVAQRQPTPGNGGGRSYAAGRTIVESAVNSKQHTTLVAAVKAAGLVDTLSGAGPFTVFAPTNDAFAKLPAGSVETLVKPGSKASLTKILTYHIVAGDYSTADLIALANRGGGQSVLKTLEGETLTVQAIGKRVVLIDALGGRANLTGQDAPDKNGVVHAIDRVLQP